MVLVILAWFAVRKDTTAKLERVQAD
jgi:hypothetical protein